MTVSENFSVPALILGAGAWGTALAIHWSKRLNDLFGIKIISLADTIGVSDPENIDHLFSALIPALPEVEFGAHLHTNPASWHEKVDAAYKSGCRRFDGAIKGFGGCPMAKDDLVGNMATENLVSYLSDRDIKIGLDLEEFSASIEHAASVFPI